MPVVTIHMWQGQPVETKKKLIKGVTDSVVDALGCPPEAVTVILADVPKEQWGHGGVPADEK